MLDVALCFACSLVGFASVVSFSFGLRSCQVLSYYLFYFISSCFVLFCLIVVSSCLVSFFFFFCLVILSHLVSSCLILSHLVSSCCLVLSSLLLFLFELFLSFSLHLSVHFWFYQFDLGSSRKVGKIVTKGRIAKKPMYVKRYIVRYSKSGEIFTSIKDPLDSGSEKVRIINCYCLVYDCKANRSL